jgi:GMP synthase (glutamine-hydrolysing)
MTTLRLLVLDAYAPEGRELLRDADGTEAGILFERMLTAVAGEPTVIDVRYPADPDPDLPNVTDYDGIAWTGSSLTIHHADDPRVTRQIEYARRAYQAGVPSFGSCWAAQLAVVAAGGKCAPSPRGREFGIARDIELSSLGASHPLFAEKPVRFCGFTSHQDEVTVLPGNASLLASNDWSAVQAVSVEAQSGRFWAVQYHPEYDLHEVASLCRLRADELIEQGMFSDPREASEHIEALEALHLDPAQPDLAKQLGVGPDLLDERVRTREARNWVASLVA